MFQKHQQDSNKRLLEEFKLTDEATPNPDFEFQDSLGNRRMPRVSTVKKPEKVSSDKQEFFKNFAIDLKLPNSYIEELIFYPKDPSIIVLFINYYNPDDEVVISKEELEKKKTRKLEKKFTQGDQDGNFRGSMTYANLNDESNLDSRVCEEKRIRHRKSTILFIKESFQTFKILREYVYDHYLKGPARFSLDGSLFGYKTSQDAKSFTVVKSNTLEELMLLKPYAIVPRSVFESVRDMKFNHMNNLFALIYQKRIDIFDLNEAKPDNIELQAKKIISLDEYEYILSIEFDMNSDQIKGLIAMKPDDLDPLNPSIHVVPFKDDKTQMLLGFKEIKFSNLNVAPSGYLFEFTPNLKKAVVSTYYDLTKTNEDQECVTYIYEIESRQIHQVPSKRQIRYMSIVDNYNEHTYINPFVSLFANQNDEKCYLKVSEQHKVELEFHFDQKKCRVIDVDARLNYDANELYIRIAFIRDQEQLCLFTYYEEIKSQFDEIFERQTSQQEQIIDSILNKTKEQPKIHKLYYREFQEYKLSNFQYPWIAYNDLSRKIRVKFLDNSSEDIIIKMPQQRLYATISQIRITPNGHLTFLVEDINKIIIYMYDLNQKKLVNGEEPLLEFNKNYLEDGPSIVDYIVNSREVTSTAKKFFSTQKKNYDVAFFFRTVPDHKLFVFYYISKMPQLECISDEVKYFNTKNNHIYYIRQKQHIECFNWKAFDIETGTAQVYTETEGKLISYIQSNHINRLWVFCSIQKRKYILKHLQFDKDQSSLIVLERIEVKDKNFINDLIQQQGCGYIESVEDQGIRLYLSGGSIYSIDSITIDSLSTSKAQEVVKFPNILDLGNDEYVLSQYPRVNQVYQRTLYVSKNAKKGVKRGIIMPSLISDHVIRLHKHSVFTKNQENCISFLLTLEDESQHDSDAIFRFNTKSKTYDVINIKGQIVKHGSFQDTYKDHYGNIITYGDQARIFVAYNHHKQLVTIFKLEIDILANYETSLNVMTQYLIGEIKKQAKISGILAIKFTQQQQLNDIVQTSLQVNNKGDLLMCISNSEFKTKEFMLYQIESNQFQPVENRNDLSVAGTFKQIDFEGLPESPINGFSFSDRHILAWTDNTCYVHDYWTSVTSVLSFQLDPKDAHSFIDILELSDTSSISMREELFVISIESSSKSRMVLIWDENEKQEISSADTNNNCQILLDQYGIAYVVDKDNGLLDLGEEAGGCKNLGFRKVLEDQFAEDSRVQAFAIKGQRVKVVKHIDDEDGGIACRFIDKFGGSDKLKDTLKKGVNYGKSYYNDKLNKYESSIKYNLKYFKYILVEQDLALPYSLYQLIVKEKIESLAKEVAKKQTKAIQEFEKLINQLSPSTFGYQIRNKTILHQLSLSAKELQLICDVFAEKDPGLLDMLLIKDEEMKTPLEIAIMSKNPRCINLIMTLMAKYCNETFGKCTNLFKEHFSSLIEYSSFKDFMESAFYQSDHYKQTTSLSVNNVDKLDRVGLFLPHITVAKDVKFNQMFTGGPTDNKNERNVEVNAIRADWILKSKEGMEFLGDLSVSDDMNLFGLDSIKTIVLFQWQPIKQKIISYLFIPFLIYAFAFTVSMTFIYQETADENIWAFRNFINYAIVLGVVIPLQLYFIGIEIKQFIDQGFFEYFSSFWNFFDLFTLLTCGSISVMMLLYQADNDMPFVNIAGALTVIILYIKCFYYLRIFESTASFIRMIVQMTYDIRVFLYIYFFAIVGFGNGFYLLSLTNDAEDQFVTSFIDGVTFVFRITLGDFDTEKFGTVQVWAVWLVFILTSLFIVIILLNLLIAIMGATFDKVKETEEQSRIREYLQLIQDNDFLIRRKEVFKDVKYIVSVTLDNDKRGGIEEQLDPLMNTATNAKKQMDYISNKLDELSKNQQELQTFIADIIQTQKEGLQNISVDLMSKNSVVKRKPTIVNRNMSVVHAHIKPRKPQ